MDDIVEVTEAPVIGLETILTTGRVIYAGVEGDPSEFPLTSSELAQVQGVLHVTTN